MGKIHYRKLAKCKQLRDLLHFLSDAKWHTTREIARYCDTECASTLVHELRENGYKIKCERRSRRRWEYLLLGDSKHSPADDILQEMKTARKKADYSKMIDMQKEAEQCLMF